MNNGGLNGENCIQSAFQVGTLFVGIKLLRLGFLQFSTRFKAQVTSERFILFSSFNKRLNMFAAERSFILNVNKDENSRRLKLRLFNRTVPVQKKQFIE